jgi:small-conductance mechanosensitive channel
LPNVIVEGQTVRPDLTMHPAEEVVEGVVDTMTIVVHRQHHIIPMIMVVVEVVAAAAADIPRLPWTIIIAVDLLLLQCAVGRGLEVQSDRIRADTLAVRLHRHPVPAVEAAVLDTMMIGIIPILLHEAIRMLVAAIVDPIAVSVPRGADDAVQAPTMVTGAVVELTGIVVIEVR